MEERMTVCNMSIEAGARAGMIAPDETTFAYLKGRRARPQGAAWDAAVARWRKLPTDAGARFDRDVEHRREQLEPMITYGTHPGMVVPITANVPDRPGDASAREGARVHGPARRRAAARQARAGRVRRQLHQRAPVGPASSRARAARTQGRQRRAHAGRAGLAAGQARSRSRRPEQVFTDAGAEWRESGCSMCIGMNGDIVGQGQYAVSTSNRNFEGRQGAGARTLLASPLTAAASAIARPRHRSARIRSNGRNHASRSALIRLAHASCCRSTNIDTDQIIPARFLTTTTQGRPGKQAVRRLALRRRRQRRSPTSC